MVRFIIIGAVIAVAFTLYSLVDAAMTDHTRARGVSKPVWIVIIVLLPVVGAVLWLMIGKGNPATGPGSKQRLAPDDDPRFTGRQLSDAERDSLRDLEARLKELDNETFPGEERQGEGTGEDKGQDQDKTR
ncbi:MULTISPECIES: PLD nuclease N-terminal domain-containing protein [Leucobacter]|uniref:PLD nuclease N-terminal domain-containing protein n=1 Tax=Leucobacter TaxID=55968 RepID=UPI000E6470E9|nr:PLDc N-terminal domain-containing protein [Leucobacter aridicollis]UTX53348.1 PLDc_N domain-containing protein [Leucobacter aridicollis]